MSIGKQLKIARVMKGHKQQDLAKELGINRSVLNLYENDKRTIANKHMKAILNYIQN